MKNIPNQGTTLTSIYKLQENTYHLPTEVPEPKLKNLKDFFLGLNSIYIIDNGTGMDNDTILNQWMEIGTGNKELNYKIGGRIKKTKNLSGKKKIRRSSTAFLKKNTGSS